MKVVTVYAADGSNPTSLLIVDIVMNHNLEILLSKISLGKHVLQINVLPTYVHET